MRVPIGLAAVLCFFSSASAQSRPDLGALRQRAVADSNDPGAHYDLALAFWARKQWDTSEGELRTALRIAPAYADAWLALSALSAARDRTHYAREQGDSALTRARRQQADYYRKAFLLNPLVSLRPLAMLDSVPTDVAPAIRAGIVDLYRGAYARAYALLDASPAGQRPATTAEISPVLLWHHALAAAHVDSFNVAASDFDELFSRARKLEEVEGKITQPLSANDYLYLASTMLYLGERYPEAVAGFTRATETDASLHGAHVQMAQIYMASGMWNQAIEECQRAVDASPDDPALLLELGATLLRGNQLEQALPVLDHARRLNPRDPRIPFLMGHAAAGTGRTEEARESFSQFLAIAPSTYGSQITQAKAELQKLR